MAPLQGMHAMGEQDIDRKSSIVRFATLLGAFRLKKFPRNTKKNDGCLSTLFSSQDDAVAVCSVPSLSLNSYNDHRAQHHSHQQDKHQMEEHAALKLARRLVTSTKPAETRIPGGTGPTQNLQSVTSTTETPSIHQLPLHMLDNLAKSFLTLVDARMRAYITILARHGVSLSKCPALTEEEQQEGVLAVERKLQTLMEVGSGISIDNMVAFFRIDPNAKMTETKQGEASMPLVMETTLDVAIPKVDAGSELVTVAVSAKGTIQASFDAKGKMLTHVHVDIDTHELLAQLIDRASLVMSMALDIVIAVSALPARFPPAPLPKHKKNGGMPPPKPVAAQVSLAVVSPDLSPKRKDHEQDVVALDLEETWLSPESCANIVDFVIGEVSHFNFPPLKRLKTA